MTRVVQNEGVTWDNRWYDAPELINWLTTTVEIGIDRDDLTKLYIFVPDKRDENGNPIDPDGGRLICKAEWIKPQGFSKPGVPMDMEQLAQRKRLEREKMKHIRLGEDKTAQIAGMDNLIAVEAQDDDEKDEPEGTIKQLPY